MSALDGWIDVFRAGEHTDSRGKKRDWTESDLDGVVSAHQGADPAPVVVGHPEMDAPAYGWVDGLRRSGDSLQAKLRDIDPAFREAVETGRYAGRSVALEGDGADGFKLQHLGFLGGLAPAVKGLAPTQFSAPAATTYEFAATDAESWGWTAAARVFRRLREWIIERDGQEKADGLIPEWEINSVMDAGEDTPNFAAPGTGANGNTGTNTNAEDDMSQDDKDTAFAGRERLAAARTEVEEHVKAGRVLPAEKEGLAAFAASLPDADDAVLKFAAPGEDGGEISETPRKFFSAFLKRLPKRIDYGETADGDRAGDGDAQDPDAVAVKARALMAADKSGTLTLDKAVRRVMANAGGGGANA